MAEDALSNHVVVIGAGLVGLATARQLQKKIPTAVVTVLEKENGVAQHQSTHNSGVLHAGLYYKPGSLKARLAVEGLREMIEFCGEHGVAFDQCGKLVVATNESEVTMLRGLLERGTQNGLSGLAWLDRDAMLEREPHVGGIAAVHVPEEGIVDYAGVAAALAREVANSGTVRTGARVTKINVDGQQAEIGLSDGDSVRADFIVGCGGLYSDRLAAMGGVPSGCRIVPFRGEYYKLRPASERLVRHLIYPVPNPAFPFLGVHFTRMIGGGIEAGPNAVLALSREGYRKTDFNFRDVASALGYSGLWAFLGRHGRIAAGEVRRSLSRKLFAESLRRLVPEISEDDLGQGGSGVRAQAMNSDGTLVGDFAFAEGQKSIFVISAPSPAATASLAIGRVISERVAARLAA